MKERTLGRTGLKVQPLGFGGIPIQRLSEEDAIQVVRRCYERGINYFDTARNYTVSEERIGKALEDVRNEVFFATKTHAQTRDTALGELEVSLKNLRTEYIDVYQLHSVSTQEAWAQVSSPDGVLTALYQARDEGKIRHIGITSHSSSLLTEIVKEDVFETIMIPFNYLATEPAATLLPLCHRMNVGTIIMKPFGGGAFSNARTALKFVLSNENVDVVIPGMMSGDEVEENVAIASTAHRLLDEEFRLIERDRAELGDQFCRGCDYCQPCPQQIPISTLMRWEVFEKRVGWVPRFETRFRDGLAKASTCIDCGECEARCPYHLPIRELLAVKTVALKEKHFQ